MQQVKPVRKIFVDVFGTALIAHEPVLEAYEYILQEIGFANPRAILKRDRNELLLRGIDFQQYAMIAREQYRKMTGINVPNRVCANALDKASDLFDDHAESHHVRPEWLDFLYTASSHYNLEVCLASNLAKPYIRTVEEKFPEIYKKFYSCRMGMMKPHAEFFHQCCKETDIVPAQAVMIGNSLRSDIRGAEKAGFAMNFWAPEMHIYDPSNHERYNGVHNLMEVFPALVAKGYLPQ